jgi:uncharacterized protein (TIGR01619 family)
MKGLQTNTIIFIGFFLLLSGQFYKVSGQSQAKFQTNVTPVKTDDHQPEWDFYLSNVDEKMSSLFVDLGLYKVAPLEDKSIFAWVSIRMNDARLNGLASSTESEILRKIEEKLVAKLYSKFKSIYAGNLTSNGSKDFYFYIGDTTNYTQVLSDFILAFPAYKFEYGAKTDENWSGYFDFLYPSPQQFQSIQNRRIIDQLEKNGDKLTQMREVDHWIYFKTKRDRDQFLDKIKFEGFTIVSRDHDKKSGGLPFKLHITRIDKVDWNSVDAYVIYLWKLANEFNGVYDGWETSVKKY